MGRKRTPLPVSREPCGANAVTKTINWHDHIKSEGKYRSKFEAEVARQLQGMGATFLHEHDRIEYRNHEGTKVYIPDFTVYRDDGTVFFIEAKGWIDTSANFKMRAVKNWNPKADIRFVFQSASARVAKLKSTVCQWAKRYKFPYAVGEVPDEWLTV